MNDEEVANIFVDSIFERVPYEEVLKRKTENKNDNKDNLELNKENEDNKENKENKENKDNKEIKKENISEKNDKSK